MPRRVEAAAKRVGGDLVSNPTIRMTNEASPTNQALADPELLAAICAHVADGGTLVGYCATREPPISRTVVNRWIEDDESRAKRYKLALDIREAHARDLILSQLIAWCRAKPLDAFTLVDRNGVPTQAMKVMQEWPTELQALVAAIKFEEVFEWQGEGKDRERVHVGRIHEIKFYDKPRSIETFMKHLQMLVERHEIDVGGSLAELVAGSMKKADAPA